LKELFFDYLKLRGNGTSTDKANRKLILKNPMTSGLEKEMLTTLDRFIEEAKFLGTFADAKLSADDRFRTDYKQYGVARAPGRLSSSQLITGEGGNQQNQPLRARGMYITDFPSPAVQCKEKDDIVFCYFDLSQAEARVVAYRANIPKWKEQFERARIDDSYDCHRALAADMFKVPYDQTPKDDWTTDAIPKPTIRFTSKRCRHGLNYRMERFRLAEVTGLPYHEAARAFSLYHQITPELRKWWEQEEKQFRATKRQYNALGRRNLIVQRMDDDALETVVAFYPQSTIGDKVVQVWYQAEEDDKWPDKHYARVALNVHDNLVAMTTRKYAKTVLKILKTHAESPLMIQDAWNRKPEKLIIPAELKMSYRSEPVFDKQGRVKFEKGPNGFHRWSHMDKVKL
jgi:DNA polymerase I-like protein with 3'-5' exonuclease and polymerase domains